MKYVLSFGLVLGCLVASCAKSDTEVTTISKSSGDPLRDKYTDGYSYAEVDGVVRSKSDKESEFAGKTFSGTSDFANKDYTKKDYASKRWAGNKDYENKSYAGNTDGSRFQFSPSYVQDQARYGSMKASADGKAFDSNVIDRVSARENTSNRLDHNSSWYAQRDNVDDPIILGTGNQGSMSLNQTREVLGREDN